jgi:hypothetical protein
MNITSSSVSTTTNQNNTSLYTAAWLTGASWPAGPACWASHPGAVRGICPAPGSYGLDGRYPGIGWPNRAIPDPADPARLHGTQIPICSLAAPPKPDAVAVQIGGSASGYQPDFA